MFKTITFVILIGLFTVDMLCFVFDVGLLPSILFLGFDFFILVLWLLAFGRD